MNFAAAQGEVAPSWKNPNQWFQTNAVAVATLSNFLKDQEWLEKYVHISTPEVYGTCDGLIEESTPINPSSPYAASKAAGDLMLFTLVKSFSFPAVLIRATNVYGAHQQLFRIIPRSIIYLKLGKKGNLNGSIFDQLYMYPCFLFPSTEIALKKSRKEFADHKNIAHKLNARFYFAHPYA